MILLLSKMDGLTLCQVPSITFPQQMLQDGTVGKSGDYMAGTRLFLITLQDI